MTTLKRESRKGRRVVDGLMLLLTNFGDFVDD